jgi:hypothetical protein
LRASKLAGEIDDLDPSILGSGGSISLTKRLVPTIGTENTFNIEFSNALKGSVDSNNPVVSSTFFTSNGRNGRIVDDGKGLLTFVSAGDGGVEEVVNPNVGTVDYLIGKVFINRLFINDFAGSYLKITAAPALFDINPVNNQILLIDSTDVRVVAIAERETANV